ncbi:MAG: ABC transporter transmembrane domain-containing protein [Aliidongia sp.]
MTEPAKRPNVAALRLLLPFLAPYRWRVLGAALALVVAAGMMLALGPFVRQLIDKGFSSGSRAGLDATAVQLFGVVAVLAVATFCRYSLVSWLGERLAADLRRGVFDRLLDLSPAFFETARTGEILSRLSADTSILQTVIGSAISQWLRNGLMLTGGIILLIVTSPKLAAVVIGIVPVIVVPLIVFGRREKRLSRAAQDRVADIGAYAEEAINAIRTVQSFTHEQVDRQRFGKTVEAVGRDCAAPDQHACLADPDRHSAGLRRHHLRALARRARGDRGAHDRRRAVGLCALCRAGRDLRQYDHRTLG